MTGHQPSRSDAKDWAHEHLRGVNNVILPSFRNDLSGLNEQAVRHDVRRNIELGFTGALLTSEAGTTLDEMNELMEIAVDEAAGRQLLILHGMFDTADQIVAMTKNARAIGVDAVLLSYPNSFYPTSVSELNSYSESVCAQLDLPTILFAAWHWNFGRLHPSGFPLETFLSLAEHENVVAVKYEPSKGPGEVAIYECFKAFAGTKVRVSDAQEVNLPTWHDEFGIDWLGTANFEYYGDSVPRIMQLLTSGQREAALELYWRIQPARLARAAVQGSYGGANFVHRYLWKYQAWLNGFSGGPLRQPAMKLSDSMMETVRAGMLKSGLEPDPGSPADFFRGRFPTS